MKATLSTIAATAGLSRHTVASVLDLKPHKASSDTLSRISSAISKLYYPVTVDDLRAGVGISSNPFLVSIRERRRIRRDAVKISSLKSGLEHLLSLEAKNKKDAH